MNSAHDSEPWGEASFAPITAVNLMGWVYINFDLISIFLYLCKDFFFSLVLFS